MTSDLNHDGSVEMSGAEGKALKKSLRKLSLHMLEQTVCSRGRSLPTNVLILKIIVKLCSILKRLKRKNQKTMGYGTAILIFALFVTP